MTERRRNVYVGSGNWGGNTGKIQVFSLDLEAAALEPLQVLEAGGVAAFMARSPDGRRLYVADESDGTLASYSVAASTGRLELLNRIRCAGHPVYVTLDARGEALVTCYFAEAKTEVFNIEADGRLGSLVCSVDSGRESHCTAFDPSQRFLFVPTRGDNWVAQYRYDPATQRLTPNEPAVLREPAGAGPRHLTFHPNGRWAYLVNELTLTLSVFAFDAEVGTLRVLRRDIALAPPELAGGSAADVHVHPNGKFLYVSNRQDERSNIAIFAIDEQSGKLELVGHEPTRGKTPRNFALDPEGRLLIAGNQDSSDIAVFRVDARFGSLTFVRSVAVAPGPFFVGIY